MFALGLAEAMVTFETTMIFAATPTLIRTFGNPLLVGQLVAVHPMIAAAVAPLAGRLGDIHGRKRVILWLLALATLGSVLSAVTANFWLILVGRALQGMSIAVLSLSIGVLRETMPPDKLTMSIGFIGAGPSVGSICGLILGGYIVDHFAWQTLFATSAVLIAVSWLAVWASVPAIRPVVVDKRIDWIEALLPLPAISALLAAIAFTKDYPFVSLEVLGLGLVSLICGLIWARRALRAAVPFVDLRLFAIRDFAIVNAATVLLAAGTMKIVYLFSIYLQSPRWTGVGLGLSATVAGLTKLPSTFLSVTAGPVASWVALRTSNRTAFVGACTIAVLGWLYALSLPDSIVAVAVVLAIISYGTTMLQTTTANVIVDSVPEGRTSEAMGTMSVLRGIGLAIGAQLITLSLATFTATQEGTRGEFPTAFGYRFTMTWIALVTLSGAIMALFLSRRRIARPSPAH
jgi:MFS family permease